VPTIVSLKERAQDIIRGELDKSSAWLQNLSQEDRENVEILAGSIVNKILHDPIVSLKEESQDHAATPYVAALRRLFNLDNET
jgi:glutamyl-tRNA reductase